MSPEVEEKHLHGELVSYGVLVQLVFDNKIKELKKIKKKIIKKIKKIFDKK